MSGILPSEIVQTLLDDWRTEACWCHGPGGVSERNCAVHGPKGQERALIVGAVIEKLRKEEMRL